MTYIKYYRSQFYNPSTYIKPHCVVGNHNIINIETLLDAEELHDTNEQINDNIFDIPPYYGTALTIMRHEWDDGIIRDFVYALYATCYQETQAIIFQSTIDMELQIKNGLCLTINDVKKSVKETEEYGIFTMIIETSQIILNMEDNVVDKAIVNYLQKYHFECTSQWVKLQCEKMINIAQKALKKIIRNALLILEN